MLSLWDSGPFVLQAGTSRGRQVQLAVQVDPGSAQEASLGEERLQELAAPCPRSCCVWLVLAVRVAALLHNTQFYSKHTWLESSGMHRVIAD